MNNDELMILWLSADKRAAADMALLYARDSILNGWFKSVVLLLWGPTVQSAAFDGAVQTELGILTHLGCQIKACKACALRYGVVNELTDLGIEVVGLGEELSERLRSKQPVLLI
ncbi:MAG: hypothetical protein J5968_05585 [Oscillospiraceae bacterium]|nr:hypothetical protein [Oscillospiraceae bacterium]